MRSPAVIIHIPHSSSHIPDKFLGQYLLDRREIERELLLMTDWFTDELFAFPPRLVVTVKYSLSRLVADSERFRDDAEDGPKVANISDTARRTPMCRIILA